MRQHKNKTIIVASESPDLYTSKRILIEARKLKFSSSWINPYQQMVISTSRKTERVTPEPNHLYFHRTTGIRYDDFDLVVASDFMKQGYKVSNPTSALGSFRDKFLQSQFMNEQGLPQIETISYRGELKEIYWDAICTLSPDEKFIIKMCRGNQGIGVNLVNGLQSLKSFLETFHALKDQRFVIQPFIEHKKEYRIFVIKQEIAGIIERTLVKEDFRGNSKRSKGKYLQKINAEIAREVLRAASVSGLDYFGVDIILDKSQFYFLEINPVPGFLQLEELSGKNIARELILKNL